VSSGRTARHRLHRGGDRDANSALWRIALVRMLCHQPTEDYVTRRTAEGRTKKEILRCLKRYIARETYALLPGSGAPSESAACPDIMAAMPSSVANM
jgi:transposase